MAGDDKEKDSTLPKVPMLLLDKWPAALSQVLLCLECYRVLMDEIVSSTEWWYKQALSAWQEDAQGGTCYHERNVSSRTV